jgi:hypothetical protein
MILRVAGRGGWGNPGVRPVHHICRGGLFRMTKADTLQMVDHCVHHWVLQPPRGELTPGKCKKCGAEREFTGETSYRIGRGSSHRH